MAYPNAFCVKCGTKTDTKNKHTVLLANSSRALRGECPTCASDVYKILPKGQDFADKPQDAVSEAASKAYPNAYCVRCHEQTETVKPHTVIMENSSRALTGHCKKCGSEVYRIMSQKNESPKMPRKMVFASPKQPSMSPAKIQDKLGKVMHLPSAAPRKLAPKPGFIPAPVAMSDRRLGNDGQGGKNFWLAIGIMTGIVGAFVVYSLV